MDAHAFATHNPELFMQIFNLGQELAFYGYYPMGPVEAFELQEQLHKELAADLAEQELEERLRAEHNYTPDEVVETPEDEPSGCPRCGSYEGDWQECPECGHGQ